jgi:hypothetical protein
MPAQLFHPCPLFMYHADHGVSWVHSKALTDAITPIHRQHNCNLPNPHPSSAFILFYFLQTYITRGDPRRVSLVKWTISTQPNPQFPSRAPPPPRPFVAYHACQKRAVLTTAWWLVTFLCLQKHQCQVPLSPFLWSSTQVMHSIAENCRCCSKGKEAAWLNHIICHMSVAEGLSTHRRRDNAKYVTFLSLIGETKSITCARPIYFCENLSPISTPPPWRRALLSR